MTDERDASEARALNDELHRARDRVRSLEERLSRLQGKALVSREARAPLTADIEFIGEFDVVRAQGVDVSAGGICFEVPEPLTFEMRFDSPQGQQQRRARLVWMRSLPEGRYRLGMQFAADES